MKPKSPLHVLNQQSPKNNVEIDEFRAENYDPQYDFHATILSNSSNVDSRSWYEKIHHRKSFKSLMVSSLEDGRKMMN